jgi:hypothetical protein
MAQNVLFKVGTRDQFDAIVTKSEVTLYWLTDTQELYKGDVLFGTGALATQSAAGLLSSEDKKKLDELASGAASGLSPVAGDGIVINNNVIGVNISDNAHGLVAVNGTLAINIATTEKDGAMSAADKAALDALVALGIVDNDATKTEMQAIFDKITSVEESFTWTEM